MVTQRIRLYDSPHQFEPLMPSEAAMRPLLEHANDMMLAAKALGSSGLPGAHREIRALLRSMNSYYSNRLEGEHTRPSEIENALRQDFSEKPDLARRQRLAVAHIVTEAHCEAAIDERVAAGLNVTRWLYEAEALEWLHEGLFASLGPEDRTLADGSAMTPGQLRTREVKVGLHEAPAAASVPAFLKRWGDVYGGVRRGDAAVVAVAASHQRLAWVHPFPDGNGRVARLHTHLLLHSMGLLGGLWSPLRGYARSADRYKALLQAADEPRRGDLDGRGNLTQAGLVEWIGFTLDVCFDQVRFMGSMLDIGSMRERIAAALSFEQSVLKSGIRAEALTPLHYLFTGQAELPRAVFKQLTGLGERVATSLLSALLAGGYLASDTPYGPVRFAVPRHALRFYFPALWPEAEQDEALLASERRQTPARAP